MYVHKHSKGQAVCMFINTAKDRQCVCSNQIVYFGQCVYLSQIMYVPAMYVFKPDYLCSGEVYIC